MLKPLVSPFGVQRLASTGTRASACWDGRMGVFYEVQIKCLCVILTMIPTEFEPPSSPIKMGNLTIRLIRQKSWKCSLLTTKICFTNHSWLKVHKDCTECSLFLQAVFKPAKVLVGKKLLVFPTNKWFLMVRRGGNYCFLMYFFEFQPAKKYSKLSAKGSHKPSVVSLSIIPQFQMLRKFTITTITDSRSFWIVWDLIFSNILWILLSEHTMNNFRFSAYFDSLNKTDNIWK